VGLSNFVRPGTSIAADPNVLTLMFYAQLNFYFVVHAAIFVETRRSKAND
jgi:hypothetical protein